MKTCHNCRNVKFRKVSDEESVTCCTMGHWVWGTGAEAYKRILKRNNDGCEDWELLESMRGSRGEKTGC